MTRLVLPPLHPASPPAVTRPPATYRLYRYIILRTAGLALPAFAALLAPAARAADPARPNILWITAEDMSPHVGSYGAPDVRTPHLDRFSGEAVRYTRAFATASVCSPARFTLVTGRYATSLGTQRLRSQFPIPTDVLPFPALLRRHGYYTSNNVKTDYNVADEPAFIRAAWDESSATAHWRKRPAGRPFFSVVNLMTTHQSRAGVWPRDQFEREIAAPLPPADRADPARLTLPPFYPDTPGTRRAWARYLDCIAAMDAQVGRILADLAVDGVADDTIVFFFSDHGMGLPRGKRTLYDSGLQVPLLVRFPARWRHLAPAAPGGTRDELVSFVDFAPSVLALAGAPLPAALDGRPFLGAAAAGRPSPDFIFGARDRVDEVFDLSRSVRDRRWLYIRNFMPHLPGLQPEAFSDLAEFRRELRALAAAGRATGGFAAYAAAPRPREELYDTVADPHQLTNLAADPRHRATLERLRSTLRTWQLATRDAGFVTETQVWSGLPAAGTPSALVRDDNRYPLARLLDAAALVGDPAPATRHAAARLLSDPHPALRYWAAVSFRARSGLDAADRAALRPLLADPEPSVRLEAAAALAAAGDTDPALPVLAAGLADPSGAVGLHAARALELLGPRAAPARTAMTSRLARARTEEAAGNDYGMFVRFSLESALAPAP